MSKHIGKRVMPRNFGSIVSMASSYRYAADMIEWLDVLTDDAAKCRESDFGDVKWQTTAVRIVFVRDDIKHIDKNCSGCIEIIDGCKNAKYQ